MLKKNKLTGERVKKLRKEKGMTQEDLASAVGYSGKGAIARIESGDNGVSLEKLIAIAGVLDVAPDYLTGASELPYTASSGRPAAKELISRVSNPDCYTQLTDFEIDRLTYLLNNSALIDIDYNDVLVEVISNKVLSEGGKEAIIRYGNPFMPGNQCEYSVYLSDQKDPAIVFKVYINHFEPTMMLQFFKVETDVMIEITKRVMEELIKAASLFRMTKFYVGEPIIDNTKISPDDTAHEDGIRFFESFNYCNMKLEINK